MKERLIPIKYEKDIPEPYRNTSIAKLLQYHNLGASLDSYQKAELLIIMCMDNRLMLKMPMNFSFVARNAGATHKTASFSISFAIAIGGVQYITVIGHSDCNMADLESKKEVFVRGLSERCAWKREEAETHFLKMLPYYKKEDAAASVISDVKFIRSEYPGFVVAPLFYLVEDNNLYLIEEDGTIPPNESR